MTQHTKLARLCLFIVAACPGITAEQVIALVIKNGVFQYDVVDTLAHLVLSGELIQGPTGELHEAIK